MALVCKNIVDKSIREMFLKSISNFKSDNFKNDLEEKIANFMPSILSFSKNNVNHICDEFYSILTSTINIHAALKKLFRKQTRLKNKLWISKGLLVSIKKSKSS